jgi:N6-L-threonylcarbamoyladenine synthase
MDKYILGLDTSNYTTSIAVVDEQKNLLYDKRKILTVKEGEKGLRQSEAFFQHIINIPALLNEIPTSILKKITSIGISSQPRPLPNSYMPVFRAGESFGKSFSHILGCNYVKFSHQEGHIEAAKWSLQKDFTEPFIAVHLSGGTTEILQVKENHGNYQISIVGGTSDISTGQFIDRVGVKLGFSFPCGKAMDDMIAASNQNADLLPTAVDGSYMSFSGPETMAYRLIEKGYQPFEIVSSVFRCIAESLIKSIAYVSKETGLTQILFLGGVSSSKFIREYLNEKAGKHKLSFLWGNPKYCTDNAVGTALLAVKKLYQQSK